MGSKSAIEWTDASWTPIRARNLKTGKVGWHCEHSTTGCEFCYAEGMNKRLGTGLPFKPGHRKDIEIFLDEKMLLEPLRWKKPRMIFVCSMTDLFADFVPDEWIDKVFAVMELCPQHTFQVLTKRAERMRAYFADNRVGGDPPDAGWLPGARASWGIREAMPSLAIEELRLRDEQWDTWQDTDRIELPLPNVWLGVSAERQKEFDERWPHLRDTPAAVRFVSYEPALGPLDISLGAMCRGDQVLNWLICGGESGPNARPMNSQWARDVRDQCKALGINFFFKQWGAWLPYSQREAGQFRHSVSFPDNGSAWRVGKKAAGRLLDGKEHNDMPPLPSALAATSNNKSHTEKAERVSE